MSTNTTSRTRVDLAAIRQQLASVQGKQYWRSLEEVANTEAFQELLQQEFPRHASVWSDSLDRRSFLQLMGASLALAGLNGCMSPPHEKIVPYVRAPEELIPGKPLFFATATVRAGRATGILAESHMGRPTKIEGNPQHPASLGATDTFAQAEILTLYDPDRAQVVSHAGRISTWETFLTDVRAQLGIHKANQGTGLRILTETVISPTLARQLQTMLNDFPQAQWHQYEPAGRHHTRSGAQLAFGEAVETHYHLDQADVIVSLDADFLGTFSDSVRTTRDFSARRRVDDPQANMNRLYVLESTPSLTGAIADHHLPLRPREIEQFARILAQQLGVSGIVESSASLPEEAQQWISPLLHDLKQHQGTSVVIVGEGQPPLLHALAHVLNHTLGNIGTTVSYTDSAEAQPTDHVDSLRALVRDMQAGQVETLLILGGNPVYTAPADLDFGTHLAQVKVRIHLGVYEDETTALCQWHIPEAHPLETWSDARAGDGTATILQPLIAPLYDGKSAHELLAALFDQSGRSGHDIVQDYWRNDWTRQHHASDQASDFNTFWQTALHDGIVVGSAFPTKSITPRTDLADWTERSNTGESRDAAHQTFDLIFQPDPTIWDGRFANNGWLQELPKPLTKLTWDNAALISPHMAEQLGVTNEEVVELRFDGRSVEAPVWITPGHVDKAVSIHLGYGRTRAGRVGTGAGFNAYALRTTQALWSASGLEIGKTGKTHALACTQDHSSMEGRPLIRTGTLTEYQQHPHFAHEMSHDPPPDLSMHPPYSYDGYAWGMTIDLNSCIGCNACTLACQAENNIPVVGKEQVAAGREMHWIRIDRYYSGDLDNPDTDHQPIPCMQCENAPCEVVCPVGATAHSDEGLNDMVYNRCVGTRYCSNNCPYKVRRFNFFQYADYDTPSLKLLNNPDVTVRTRGVMEKCTYCVQRINTVRIDAKKEDRAIRDGEIVPACAQVCPAQAITFGDINDGQSRVSQRRAEPRQYGLLTELNTRPRTTYLAKLRNPNPELAPQHQGGRHDKPHHT